MLVLIIVSICGVTTCDGNTAALLPVTSDNSLLGDCHRQGEIGTTRTGWISNN